MTSIAFPYNPPSSPFLRVTYRQKPNLKWQNLSLQTLEDPKKETEVSQRLTNFVLQMYHQLISEQR